MDFPYTKKEALSRARRFEIDMEVKAMGAVPYLRSFAGLVYCLDGHGRREQSPIVDRKADELFQAASINKLAIALALGYLLIDASEDELHMRTLSWECSEVVQGGGLLDRADAPREAPIFELAHDMLAHSGNTAAKALVKLVGAQKINQQLFTLGFNHTQLKILDKGTFEFGVTTPREALTILTTVLDEYPSGNHSLFATYKNALSNSTSKYGVRGMVGTIGTSLANKTGQLNQEEGVPEALRHDVGALYNADGRRILYAFFSRSSADSAAQAANIAIGDLGHLLAKEAGLEDEVDTITRRHLAQTALKGVANRAKSRIGEKAGRKQPPRLK